LVEVAGSSNFTVTLPNPTLYNGGWFQIWLNTTNTITFSTPSGNIYGPTGPGTSTMTATQATTGFWYLFASDGFNWAVSGIPRLDSSGNLLVGTTNGNVGYGGGSGIYAHKNGQLSLGTSGGLDAFFLQKDNTGGSYLIFYYGSLSSTPSGVGSITTNGSSTSFNTSSDYRLKTNVTPLTTAQSGPIIDALKPSQFTWTTDNTPDVGFIAHEMQAVIPKAVTGEKDAVDAEGKPVYQQVVVSSPEIIAYLVAELQSVRSRLAGLESTVATQATEIATLKAKVGA